MSRKKYMKKIIALMLAACAMGIALVGCTNSDPSANSIPEVEETPNSDPSMGSTVEDEGTSESTNEDSTIAEEPTSELSDEMQNIKDAVIDALGEDYAPNMTIPAETLEGIYGISSEMYEDCLAEMPMISVNVDTLIVVKPAEGQKDKVEEALTNYQKDSQENLMNYPMNMGKIQASEVTTIGDYVVFVQLGGDTSAYESDEDIMKHCEEDNAKAIDAMTAYIESTNK